MRVRSLLCCVLLCWLPVPAAAAGLMPDARHAAQIRELAEHPALRAAFARIVALEADSQSLHVELTEIPAPPFGERERAERLAEEFTAVGVPEVWIDAEGNVVGRVPGSDRSPAAGGAVLLVAHLDTVFPPHTDVRVRRTADRLLAPGIGDNARGLVTLTMLARVLCELFGPASAQPLTEGAALHLPRDILLVGSVGEEGVGDLRGVRHLLDTLRPAPAAVIAIDGGSLGRIVNQGVASLRYRLRVLGAGGHSWGSFGHANPALALAEALARFDTAAAPLVAAGPAASYSAGRLGGGQSVNAIPAEAWAEIDLRSVVPERLRRLDELLRRAVDQSLASHNGRRRGGRALHAQFDVIGRRPAGRLDPAAPLVQRALAASRWLGATPRLAAGSTDANAALARGLPAITISRGGRGGQAHSTDEWWSPAGAARAVQQALLISLASAEVIASAP